MGVIVGPAPRGTSGTTTGSSVTSVTPTINGREGDLLLLVMSTTSAVTTGAAPAGWTVLESLTAAIGLQVWGKIADAFDNGSTPTFSWTGSSVVTYVMTACTSFDRRLTLTSLVRGTKRVNGASTFVTVPGVPVNAQSLLLGMGASRGVVQTISAGWTSLSNAAGLLVATMSRAGLRLADPATLSTVTSTASEGQTYCLPGSTESPQHRASTVPVTSASGTTAAVAPPAGARVGDRSIVYLVVPSATTVDVSAFTALGCVTLLDTTVGTRRLILMTKEHVATDSTGSAFTFGASTPSTVGWDVFTPCDVDAAGVNTSSGTVAGSIGSSPAVTTLDDRGQPAYVVWTYGAALAGTVVSSLGGQSVASLSNSAGSMTVTYEHPPTPAGSSTGNRTFVFSTAGPYEYDCAALALYPKTAVHPAAVQDAGVASAATATATATIPPGAVAGQVALVLVGSSVIATMTTVPSGWSLVGNSAATAPVLFAYTKVLTDADITAGTAAWVLSAATGTPSAQCVLLPASSRVVGSAFSRATSVSTVATQAVTTTEPVQMMLHTLLTGASVAVSAYPVGSTRLLDGGAASGSTATFPRISITYENNEPSTATTAFASASGWAFSTASVATADLAIAIPTPRDRLMRQVQQAAQRASVF